VLITYTFSIFLHESMRCFKNVIGKLPILEEVIQFVLCCIKTLTRMSMNKTQTKQESLVVRAKRVTRRINEPND